LVEALHAARTAAADAADKLLALAADASAPAIARATALAELGDSDSRPALPAIEQNVRDPDPLVRSAAARMLLVLDPVERLRIGGPLLEDPVRAVRIHAARALADAAVDALPSAQRDRLRAGFDEYVASQHAAAERPEAHVNLGMFYTERGAPADAEREYRTAIRLQPAFTAAYVNLADLYRTQGREREAEATLRDGLAHVPGDGDLAYALALARVRQSDRVEAIDLLRQAVGNRPENPHYAYVYAVALRDAGRPAEALAVLESALTRFPTDRDLLFTAAMTAHEAGRREDAGRHARALSNAAPADPRTAAVVRELGLER
jgi:Flp pilus assembly protein TadD